MVVWVATVSVRRCMTAYASERDAAQEVCFYSFLPPSAIQRVFKEVFRVADDFQTHVILGLVIF